MAANNSKDTIYIDIDDEITAVIDKLRAGSGKIAALVLPKRASVLQSIVNMKLLKRAADDAKKHLVLITTEAGLLPLAGAVGIHVAKTLSSKPEIPTPPQFDDGSEETVDEDDAELSPDTPVGALAGVAAGDGVETLQMEDEEGDAADLAAAGVAAKSVKLKKNSKLHVPNFERFRVLLALGILALIALIVGGIFAVNVLPKAAIAITTDATALNVNLGLKLDTAATKLDPTTNTLPAKLATENKSYTQQAPATGTKNNGDKAAGDVTITNCTGAAVSIPAGTGFSSGAYTFIGQQSVTVPDSNYTHSGDCKNDGVATVTVKAQSGGTAYNLSSGTKYTISKQDASVLSAVGAAMSGGTDNITKVVSQADIDGARAKISTADTTVKQALINDLSGQGYTGLKDTYNAGTPVDGSSVAAGTAADNVTVTETVTYTMFGVHDSDLKTLVDAAIKKQIDTTKQSILSDGVAQATYNIEGATGTTAQVTMTTTATAGPDLNTAQIKKDAAGKKPGEVKSQLQTNPDVTAVDVKLSPFWVTSVPKNQTKITVTIAKPKVSANTHASP